MTLNELKAGHPDLVGKELSWDDLRQMASGAAVLYASLSAYKRPKGEQRVLWAGHALTAGMRSGDELYAIRATSGGNSAIDVLTPGMVGPDGRAAVFLSSPIAEPDPRNLAMWPDWANIAIRGGAEP